MKGKHVSTKSLAKWLEIMDLIENAKRLKTVADEQKQKIRMQDSLESMKTRYKRQLRLSKKVNHISIKSHSVGRKNPLLSAITASCGGKIKPSKFYISQVLENLDVHVLEKVIHKQIIYRQFF